MIVSLIGKVIGGMKHHRKHGRGTVHWGAQEESHSLQDHAYVQLRTAQDEECLHGVIFQMLDAFSWAPHLEIIDLE